MGEMTPQAASVRAKEIKELLHCAHFICELFKRLGMVDPKTNDLHLLNTLKVKFQMLIVYFVFHLLVFFITP